MSPASTNARRMFQVLGALDDALATARAAVLAVHPELNPPQAEGGADHPRHPAPLKLSPAGWRGDEVLEYMTALSEAIARYTLTLEVERALAHRRRRAA